VKWGSEPQAKKVFDGFSSGRFVGAKDRSKVRHALNADENELNENENA
jgi:hypothetical protein